MDSSVAIILITKTKSLLVKEFFRESIITISNESSNAYISVFKFEG